MVLCYSLFVPANSKEELFIMKKKISILLAAVCLAVLFTGCASLSPDGSATEASAPETSAVEASVPETAATAAPVETEIGESAEVPDFAADDETIVRVGGLKGPTTMGLVKLMDDSAAGTCANNYEFTMVTAADELTALVAGGKVDIALLPANVASILYQKTEGNVRVIDINTLGVIYLISSDTSIQTVDQLKGKTVYLPGKGTTPEYALRYLIKKAGLTEEDVTLEFKSESAEVVSILTENPEAIGLLPQPFVTSALAQNDSLSVIMDLTQVWDSFQTAENPGRLVTGVTIVSKSFLEAHPDLVNTFLQEHEMSVRFTGEDPEAAAALIEQAGIVAKAQLAQKALPYCNITYIDGSDMKDVLGGYLNVLFEEEPASVGGQLPDDAFYYIP